jgi:methylated-DNA-[protein]-cysteine S-methyltransferase
MTKRMKKSRQDSFREKVHQVVAAIPRGKTLTYKEVAQKAGYPGAARAVGTLMSKNFDPLIPCHRVIRSDGTIGDYNRGGPQKKIELLMMERYA